MNHPASQAQQQPSLRAAPRRPASRSQAGAALAIPFVVVVILMIAAFGMWWVANQDIARFQRIAADDAARADKLDADYTAVIEDYQELSNLVGFRDAAVLTSKSSAGALQAAIDSAKSQLGPVLGQDDVTLEAALDALQSSYQSSQTALAKAQADYESANAARQAAESVANSIESNYKAQLSDFNQQLRDEQARADSQGRSDQQRVDDLLASEQTKDSQLRSLQRDLEDLRASAKRQQSTADATIRSLAQRQQAVQPESPDGALLSVSQDGSMVYLDIGGRDGLRRGTRFEVLRMGKGGELTPMGSVEVREVESDMALAGVLHEVDPFDPLLPGDVVRNPHFNRGESTRFFLLGDFPLTLSREFVSQRLEDLGASVDDTLSVDTDVLVLGHESLADGEFAKALTESEDFILADKLGTRILRLDELSEFLRY